MWRIGARVLAMAMVCVLMLTAVGAAKRIVTVIHPAQVVVDFYNEQATSFMENNPDVTVEVELATSSQKMNERITLGLATGDPPDIVYGQFRTYYGWADQGVLVDMLPLLEKSTRISKADYFPGVIDQLKYRGKLYLFPGHVDAMLTFFDGQYFEEAGLTDPYRMHQQSEWSWDSALRAAQKLVRAGSDGQVTFWGWNPMQNALDTGWGSFIYANGGLILTPDLRRVAFTEPAAVEALAWGAQIYNEYQVGSPGINLESGKVGMATSGLPNARRLWLNMKREKLSVAPIPPTAPGGSTSGVVLYNGTILFNKPGNVEAAWRFVEWCARPEGQKGWIKWDGSLPARRDVLKHWGEFAAAYIGGEERSEVFATAISRGQALPLGIHYNDMTKALNPAVADILNGRAPARVRLEQAAPQVQAILDQVYGGR